LHCFRHPKVDAWLAAGKRLFPVKLFL